VNESASAGMLTYHDGTSVCYHLRYTIRHFQSIQVEVQMTLWQQVLRGKPFEKALQEIATNGEKKNKIYVGTEVYEIDVC
jgi:hypothetical protein